MDVDRLTVPVECRASGSGPVLVGVILQEGRAARGGLAEVFAPGALTWPAEGIAIRTRHLAAVEATAVPVREANGEISVTAPASPAMVAAVEAGHKFMSVEFYPITETRTPAGVRELESALCLGATLTNVPEYTQTSAELREKEPAVWL